jgi:hypothetical protein
MDQSDGNGADRTADRGDFDSGAIGSGKMFFWTFNAAGKVPYHCEIHPVHDGHCRRYLIRDRASERLEWPDSEAREPGNQKVDVLIGRMEMTYTPEIGRRFWFEFDQATLHDSDFMGMVGRAGAFGVQNEYRRTRMQGTYPAAFRDRFVPRRDDWTVIGDLQTRVIVQFLGTDWADIQAAFEDFGQGILVDTDPQRVTDGDATHMMDGQVGNPPIGYPRWHASIRATLALITRQLLKGCQEILMRDFLFLVRRLVRVAA